MMKLSSIEFQTLMSVLSISLVMIIKEMILRKLNSRATKIYTKNILNLCIIIVISLIWYKELQRFTLSIIAISAALAIATKEFVLCLVGGVYLLINKQFKIGDRIEIGNHLGDVVDNNFLYTKLLEAGPKDLSQQYTGRVITIPNSIFFTQAVYNLTSAQKFSLHVFKLPFELTQDILIKKKILSQVTLSVCAPYLDEAKLEIQNMALKQHLDTPKVAPVISLYFKSSTEVEFIIRVPVPAKRRGHYQQKIIHRFLEKLGYPRKRTLMIKNRASI